MGLARPRTGEGLQRDPAPSLGQARRAAWEAGPKGPCPADSDNGGNERHVIFDGHPDNLHWVWDTGLLQHITRDSETLAAELESRITPQRQSRVSHGDRRGLGDRGAPLGSDSGLWRPGHSECSPEHSRIRTAGRAGNRTSTGKGWREAGLPLERRSEVKWLALLWRMSRRHGLYVYFVSSCESLDVVQILDHSSPLWGLLGGPLRENGGNRG